MARTMIGDPMESEFDQAMNGRTLAPDAPRGSFFAYSPTTGRSMGGRIMQGADVPNLDLRAQQNMTRAGAAGGAGGGGAGPIGAGAPAGAVVTRRYDGQDGRGAFQETVRYVVPEGEDVFDRLAMRAARGSRDTGRLRAAAQYQAGRAQERDAGRRMMGEEMALEGQLGTAQAAERGMIGAARETAQGVIGAGQAEAAGAIGAAQAEAAGQADFRTPRFIMMQDGSRVMQSGNATQYIPNPRANEAAVVRGIEEMDDAQLVEQYNRLVARRDATTGEAIEQDRGRDALRDRTAVELRKRGLLPETDAGQGGAGGAGGQVTQSIRYVKMVAPDGSVREVPQDRVEYYKSRGVKLAPQ